MINRVVIIRFSIKEKFTGLYISIEKMVSGRLGEKALIGLNPKTIAKHAHHPCPPFGHRSGNVIGDIIQSLSSFVNTLLGSSLDGWMITQRHRYRRAGESEFLGNGNSGWLHKFIRVKNG